MTGAVMVPPVIAAGHSWLVTVTVTQLQLYSYSYSYIVIQLQLHS